MVGVERGEVLVACGLDTVDVLSYLLSKVFLALEGWGDAVCAPVLDSNLRL